MTDAAEIRVIVAAVDEAAAAHPRPLRRSRRAVAASAAAVAAGLRPGAMLDSSPGLAPAAAAALAAAINAALGGAPRLAAAHLDGCCYLLSLRPLSLAPWPIFFDGAAPRWGSADDASSLAAAAVPVAGAASAHTPLDLAALPGLPPPSPAQRSSARLPGCLPRVHAGRSGDRGGGALGGRRRSDRARLGVRAAGGRSGGRAGHRV